jgi:hypothetical protein
MKKLFSLLLSLSLVLTSVGPASSQATYAAYIWEKPWVVPSTAPTQGELDARAELSDEVNKFLDWAYQTNPPRPPGPYYVPQGYISEDLFWLNTGESVLALSEALDFLSTTDRNRLIGYLKYVMTNPTISPLTFTISDNVPHPLLNKGNYRNLYAPLPDELARGYMNSSRVDQIKPPPENLYAVWAFAHYVSRYEETGSTPKAWDIISSNWGNVTTLYNQLPATPAIYWDIMGYVGYARMAKRLGQSFATAETRANNGYAAGVNYVQFYRNMKTSRWCEGNGNDQPWVGVWDYCAFTAVDPYSLYQENNPFQHNAYAGQVLGNKPSMFAPEIGRFLRERAQNAVLNDPGYGINRYLAPGGANYYAFWWETRGEKHWPLKDGGTQDPGNGENALMHPSFAWQMFMLKAHVEGAGLNPGRAAELHRYLDTPWAVGDPFHIQKLITVLRMYSTIVWSETGGTVMSVTPPTGKQNATITVTYSVVGTGLPITVTDTLPTGLGHTASSTTCTGGSGLSVNGNIVTYTGTPAAGTACTITIQATINTSQTLAVTNAAQVVDGGPNSPYTLTSVLILNPRTVSLPLIRR